MKNFNSHLHELSVVRQNVPHLRFSGDKPLDEWRFEARKKLIELLGLPLERGECGFELEYKKDFEDFLDYRFTVESEPGYFVPCHLLLPKEEKKTYQLTI